jgi:hypothetical protein
MFELKKVKYHAGLSRETHAFTADLIYNGKKVAEASNDGHGGCTDFYPVNDALFQDAIAYVNAQPEVKSEYGGTLKKDLDWICTDLMNDWLTAKELKKLLSKRVLWTKPGKPGIYQTQAARNAANRDLWVIEVAADSDTEQVLNTMPFADALALFKERT